MGDIIKRNTSSLRKMIVYQVAMTIFGLVLEMATYQYDKMLLATSIFSIGFYLVLLYTMSWEAGLADKVRIESGRIDYKPQSFFIVSALANALNLLLGILAFAGYVINGCVNDAVNVMWAAEMYSVCNMIARFIQGMYTGVLYYFTPNNPVMLIFIVFPAIITCGFGYILGTKGRTIRGLFGLPTAYDNMLESEKKKKAGR